MSGGGDRLNLSARPDFWRARAACKGKPVEWFFPPDRRPYDAPAWKPPAEALALCARCPVHSECDEAGRDEYGLWASRFRAEKHSQLRRRALEREVAEFEVDIDAFAVEVG